MKSLLLWMTFVSLCLLMTSVLAVEKVAAEEKKSLDQRAQDIKHQITVLNRDLAALEEELLFPDSPRLSVFLSMEAGEDFSLAGIQLKINNKVIANHLYNSSELRALKRGGVQRLYLGNLRSGEFELAATLLGSESGLASENGENNPHYDASLKLEKGPVAKFVELHISATEDAQPQMVFREWE